MQKTHSYEVALTWTGNTGTGTSGYAAFERSVEASAVGKPVIPGSAEPVYRGALDRWNPEELLVVSLSQCHMLWYLVLCAKEGIVVTDYVDQASGTVVVDADGGGHFEKVTLRPQVTITAPDGIERATALHERAHDLCLVARSVNFPVRADPTIVSGA